MKRTYIGRSIAIELRESNLTQMEFAHRSGLSQPTLQQIISTAVRISPQSLTAVTHNWPHVSTSARVLIAHLRDEIFRAGWDPENTLEIQPKNGPNVRTQAEKNLEILRAHISDENLAELIARLANLIKRADEAKKYPTSSEKEWGNAAEKQ
jgi:transcriptional regulator with XRE-family HTH domain